MLKFSDLKRGRYEVLVVRRRDNANVAKLHYFRTHKVIEVIISDELYDEIKNNKDRVILEVSNNTGEYRLVDPIIDSDFKIVRIIRDLSNRLYTYLKNV